MTGKSVERRDFIRSLLAGASVLALDWSAFPIGASADTGENQFDAVIIGSGLGGLSCAAAFARQGFKPLVLEKHYIPGGYATTFKRPGGFVFDVSLHSTSVGEREGIHNLIPGFPEITNVEFVPHPNLYRAIFPDYDFRVPQKDLPAYIDMLTGYFPDEKKGIEGLFDDMEGVAKDIQKLSRAKGKVDMSRFPVDFPYLFKSYTKTWGQMMDAHIKNPKLKAIISALWGYYGLPPSKLASIYYALPTIGYLQEGGYYPKGKSQKISDAFVKFIEERGGKVMLKTRVEEILVKDHTAYGVKTADGGEYTGKVVVSNANAYDTFHTMMKQDEYLKDYLARMDQFSVSLSSFQVFLGLKKDLIGEVGITDTEIFCTTGYDPEAEYKAAVNAEVEGGFGLTLYDNLYKGYSPKGKNTVNIIALQGYDHWKKYEADYFKGKKEAYRKEKERMADILIDQVEEMLLPGLRDAIEVKEIGTPLTNVRFTDNYRGAIYGWDQTLDNSGQSRLPHTTPIKNLYLSGAWTSPGHGYGGVLWSGLECFGEIMQRW
ncbi:MAG: NAD(P)/FAD-dependent oxidoreductase [candidate division Zixibacteria bacterium]|nr:NAD(P)/FAD-dependent oxidoreductase [candidate division Zixibacteria bacterium]